MKNHRKKNGRAFENEGQSHAPCLLAQVCFGDTDVIKIRITHVAYRVSVTPVSRYFATTNRKRNLDLSADTIYPEEQQEFPLPQRRVWDVPQ